MLKLVFCVALFGMTLAVPPAQYPAGVSPHECPNYPFCGNAPSAVGGQGTYYGNGVGLGGIGGGQGGYYGGQGSGQGGQGTYSYNNLGGGVAGQGGLAGGAGVGLSGAGYAGHGNANYNSLHGALTRYPAGINPAACPNYPLC